MADQDDGKESFIQRWSRLKRASEAPESEPTKVPISDSPAAPAELPDAKSVEALDFSSDFSLFLQPKIEEAVKRAALKKLFHSPHFNQMDGLDVYIDDYNKFEPIPDEMLRRLAHAKDMLFRADSDADASAEANPASSRGSEARPPEIAGPDPEPARIIGELKTGGADKPEGDGLQHADATNAPKSRNT